MPQIAAYNRLLDEPDARERAHGLVPRAGPVGQLYLLGALNALGHPSAVALEHRLLQSTDQVLGRDDGGMLNVSDVASTIRAEQLWNEWRRFKPIPVQVFMQGQPFKTTQPGLHSRDGYVELVFVEQDRGGVVSGLFSGDRMLVAFAGGTDAGGVKQGSLSIETGRGRLPTHLLPWTDGCVAIWRGSAGRPKRFALRYRLTTDPASACRQEGTK